METEESTISQNPTTGGCEIGLASPCRTRDYDGCR